LIVGQLSAAQWSARGKALVVSGAVGCCTARS